jgi:hypothetical protein
MKIKGPINQGLVFGGLYFKNYGICCRYKSLGAWKRPQWRREHPGDFVPLSEVEPSIASENETDVKTSLKTSGPYLPATPAGEKTLSTARPMARSIAYWTTKTEVLRRPQCAIAIGRWMSTPKPTTTSTTLITITAGELSGMASLPCQRCSESARAV